MLKNKAYNCRMIHIHIYNLTHRTSKSAQQSLNFVQMVEQIIEFIWKQIKAK